jgi:trk system potassium uptake protein TrkA
LAKNDRSPCASRVVVLGLGRFGASLALELVRRGSEVLGLDSDPVLVQRYADDLTHAAVADTTDVEALRQLDVPDFRRAVVGIGTDREASILTTAVLVDLGIPHIWAKATSRQHGRILERIGAHHVVLPEFDMGERVAHLVTGRMIDYIEFDDDFAMVKTAAPREILDRPLSASGVRARHGITVVAVKRPGGEFSYATPDTVVHRDDVLIVSGRINQVEAFANLT